MVFMALWLDLKQSTLDKEENKSLDISTRTVAAQLPRLKIKSEKKSFPETMLECTMYEQNIQTQ